MTVAANKDAVLQTILHAERQLKTAIDNHDMNGTVVAGAILEGIQIGLGLTIDRQMVKSLFRAARRVVETEPAFTSVTNN